MSDFAELVRAARTCRRFEEDKPVSAEILRHLVDTARITSSAANLQPLRYYIVSSPDVCAQVFPNAKWAGALPQWSGPDEGERPRGYIVVCATQPDKAMTHYDLGIVVQTMQLHAFSLGLGCCIFNNFSREPLRETLNIPADLDICMLLAFGVAKEVRHIVDAKIGDSLKYWRDEQQVHYVPKLTLGQVLLDEK